MAPCTSNAHVAPRIRGMRRWVSHVEGVSYTYDNTGNVTAIGSNTYTYNYRNRMTDGVVNGTSTHYLYDANDARVAQDTKIGAGATTTTKFWNRFYETSGATTTMYIFAGGQLIATIEGNGSATTTNVIHVDHLNGTNIVSSDVGAQKQLLNYHPYGSLRQNEQTTSFNEKRKAIGEYYDDAVVLNYYNARYMNASVGRFLAQDPMFTGDPNKQRLMNPQELNSYSYAANNPINWSDPSGLITEAQQIQTLTLQVQLLQSILKAYQSGATAQANTSFSQYQKIVGSSGYQSTMGSINTTGDKVQTYSHGSGVANQIVNKVVTPTGAAVAGGIGLAASGGAGLMALPATAPAIGTVVVGSARVAPIIESVGVSNANQAYKAFQTVEPYIARPMDAIDAIRALGPKVSTVGKVVTGSIAALWEYIQFTAPMTENY